jgi:DNA-binding GntR family transcriptional regulator
MSDHSTSKLSSEANVSRDYRALHAEKGPLIRQLLNHIVAEDLPTGAHLTEQHLADALNVSRTPVRKALVDLHAKGLVEKIAHRGYFLTCSAQALFAASLDFRPSTRMPCSSGRPSTTSTARCRRFFPRRI